jgi:hypothetical protein
MTDLYQGPEGIVEACWFDPTSPSARELYEWVGENASIAFSDTKTKQEYWLDAITLDGGFRLNAGDYLLRTADGRILPCTAEDFITRYSKVAE